jgi:DNA-binding Xre family transcriptional regulator
MPEQYIDIKSLKIIREKLWSISKDKGITLEDIQDRTGFSYSQVYRIIRGNKNTSVSHLMAVITALEVQPEDIFDFKLTIPEYPAPRKVFKNK